VNPNTREIVAEAAQRTSKKTKTMDPKKRRRKEKRARKKQRQSDRFQERFAAVLADLAAKWPAFQPPGENYFLLELGHVDDPTDLTWNRNATAIGTWDQVQAAVPVALSSLLPIRGELRFTLIQGQENIGARLAQITRDEHAYHSEKRAIPYN
jgi:hypothetical protein